MMTRPSSIHNLPVPIQMALDLLDQQDLSLSDLATQVGWSRAHLQKQFTHWVGMSPAEYARALKHQALRQHLTSCCVTRSIVDAGYGSSSRVYETTH